MRVSQERINAVGGLILGGSTIRGAAATMGLSLSQATYAWSLHPGHRPLPGGGRRGQRVPQERVDAVGELILGGMDITQTAATLGLTVGRTRHAWSLHPDHHSMPHGGKAQVIPQERIDAVGELILGGATISEAASALDLTYTVARGAWRRHPRYFHLAHGNSIPQERIDAVGELMLGGMNYEGVMARLGLKEGQVRRAWKRHPGHFDRRGGPARVSQERIDAVGKLILGGMGIKAAAERLDISVNQATRAWRKHPLHHTMRLQQGVPQERIDAVGKLIKAGVSNGEAAKRLDLTKMQVRHAWEMHPDYEPMSANIERRRESREQRERAAVMMHFDYGMEIDSIAAELDFSPAKVLSVCRRDPRWKPKPLSNLKFDPELRRQAVESVLQGVPVAAAAAKAGMNFNALYRHLRDDPRYRAMKGLSKAA